MLKFEVYKINRNQLCKSKTFARVTIIVFDLVDQCFLSRICYNISEKVTYSKLELPVHITPHAYRLIQVELLTLKFFHSSAMILLVVWSDNGDGIISDLSY